MITSTLEVRGVGGSSFGVLFDFSFVLEEFFELSGDFFELSFTTTGISLGTVCSSMVVMSSGTGETYQVRINLGKLSQVFSFTAKNFCQTIIS